MHTYIHTHLLYRDNATTRILINSKPLVVYGIYNHIYIYAYVHVTCSTDWKDWNVAATARALEDMSREAAMAGEGVEGVLLCGWLHRQGTVLKFNWHKWVYKLCLHMNRHNDGSGVCDWSATSLSCACTQQSNKRIAPRKHMATRAHFCLESIHWGATARQQTHRGLENLSFSGIVSHIQFTYACIHTYQAMVCSDQVRGVALLSFAHVLYTWRNDWPHEISVCALLFGTWLTWLRHVSRDAFCEQRVCYCIHRVDPRRWRTCHAIS